MRKKLMALVAAFALAVQAPAVPAMATEAESVTGVDAETQQQQQSSEAEKTALIIGAVLATLAAVGGGAVWAIQQGIIANPLPGILPSPVREQKPRPRYQQACNESQVQQPAMGADGKWLVCVYMGQVNGKHQFRWVYGPKPLGRGTASRGAYCRDGAEGGQDSNGRMMMCLGNEWTYGP